MGLWSGRDHSGLHEAARRSAREFACSFGSWQPLAEAACGVWPFLGLEGLSGNCGLAGTTPAGKSCGLERRGAARGG